MYATLLFFEFFEWEISYFFYAKNNSYLHTVSSFISYLKVSSKWLIFFPPNYSCILYERQIRMWCGRNLCYFSWDNVTHHNRTVPFSVLVLGSKVGKIFGRVKEWIIIWIFAKNMKSSLRWRKWKHYAPNPNASQPEIIRIQNEKLKNKQRFVF